jgi:hypothetical protein
MGENAALPGARVTLMPTGRGVQHCEMQHREAIMDESARAELIAAPRDTVTFGEGLLELR